MAASDAYVSSVCADVCTAARVQRRRISRETFRRLWSLYAAGMDFFACVAAVFLAFIPESYRGNGAVHSARQVMAFAVTGGVLVVLQFNRQRAYRAPGAMFRIRETEMALRASAAPLLLLLLVDFTFQFDLSPSLSLNPSWITLLLVCGLLPCLLIAERQICVSILRALYSKGYGVDRIIAYAASNEDLEETPDLLTSLPASLHLIALVAGADSSMFRSPQLRTMPNLPTIPCGQFTADLLGSLQCDVLVLIGAARLSTKKFSSCMDIAQQAGVTTAFLEEAGAWRWRGACLEMGLEMDSPLFPANLTLAAAQKSAWPQRLLDLAVSAPLLILLAPLLAFIAMVIRIDSSGPALFVQTRVGRHGQPFSMFKFRSMFTSVSRYEVSPVCSGDGRITRVGRVLRCLSLDELPQLFNVFRGDMSMVGPRPEMPFLVKQHNGEHRERLQVKPGITGLWQLSRDRRKPIHENIHHDLYYIRNRNFFLDLAILLHTPFGATREAI